MLYKQTFTYYSVLFDLNKILFLQKKGNCRIYLITKVCVVSGKTFLPLQGKIVVRRPHRHKQK